MFAQLLAWSDWLGTTCSGRVVRPNLGRVGMGVHVRRLDSLLLQQSVCRAVERSRAFSKYCARDKLLKLDLKICTGFYVG